jgi:hypothetical protein
MLVFEIIIRIFIPSSCILNELSTSFCFPRSSSSNPQSMRCEVRCVETEGCSDYFESSAYHASC